MGKQSVNFTPPDEEWLNAKVAGAEYASKTELVNDLIRQERQREDKYQMLKSAIEQGLDSGISEKTIDDIRNDVLTRLKKNGH